ncbi:hypothetical protein BCR44DRAFT_1449337 [Catenaria anguillulae PL171]|uniref:Uncharacterized protein n=1 Tax=Catenaria anguillulae PL171 TaxID=765915 RepID=A0A1Y2H4U7_9FUNG|nr:hypothetical protein BCR44DRAFT_1449337 [Catenaria anguillulae PL171]
MLETIPTGSESRETRFMRLASVLYSAGFYSSYLVYAVFDLASLAMGIQYILRTQQEVDMARGKSTAVLQKMDGGEQYGNVSMLQSTPDALASNIMATAPSSSFILQNSGGLPALAMSATGPPPPGTQQPHHHPPVSFVKRVSAALSDIPRRPPSETTPSDVVFWIIACVLVLFGFLAIQGYPGVLATQPAQLSFALMTLMLKIFGVCMSMAITRMTQLVTRKRRPRGAARNRGQSSQQATSGV